MNKIPPSAAESGGLRRNDLNERVIGNGLARKSLKGWLF
jgi:hypothetical protein